MGSIKKALKLISQLHDLYDTTKELAELLNGKLPEDKKITIPEMDKKESIKGKVFKLMMFVKTLKELTEEVNGILKTTLSAGEYAKITKDSTSVEEILSVVQTILSGPIEPNTLALAKKLMNGKVLHTFEDKLGHMHGLKVIQAIHDSQTTKGGIDKDHPGIQENEDELDHALKSLEPEHNHRKHSEGFSSQVKKLIHWHHKQSK